MDSARGEKCTINSPECNFNTETTVCAHSDYKEDGKGLSIKSHDIYVAYSCSSCHSWLQGKEKKEIRRDFFHMGMKRTWMRLIDKGLIKIT